MMTMFVRLSLVALLVGLNATAVLGATYSAVGDFSIAANPNGAWTYLYGGTVLPDKSTSCNSIAGLDCWYNNIAVPNSAAIEANDTGTTASFQTIVLPTNVLDLDPELNSNVDVRFTAATAGSYSIVGEFLGIDTSENSHPVEILDDGAVVFSGTIATYGQTNAFNLVESLHAGDVLDFENLTPGTFNNLSTGLAATITSNATAAPEPATLWFGGIGLIGLVTMRRHKRTRGGV